MDHRKPTDRKDEREARKRHRGVGREGLQPSEPVQPQGDEQGLGHEGVDRDGRQTRTFPVADNLFAKIPQWLKSLHQMENELRSAARNGLILRNDKATEHLTEARRLLDRAMREAKGEEPPDGPQTPVRKEGEF